MKTISIYTATRAEYGLLYNVIMKVDNDPELQLDLIVSGGHLSHKQGYTVRQIEQDGFVINDRIEILNDEEETDVSIAIARSLLGCSRHFKKIHSDMLVVLGDRYEILGPVIAACEARIPIAHIHGGEATEGAIDEAIRHAVTKFSYLHFTSCEAYRKRVIQLGENPARVFNVGALGVENILHEKLWTKKKLENDLEFSLSSYGLVTFHPVTLEGKGETEIETRELFEALCNIKGMSFIVTGANADSGGSLINIISKQYEVKYPDKFKIISSLGRIRYLTAMKYCQVVIGNSSSGILEAPSFHVPTINIGDREKGRIQTKSVINCNARKGEIIKAIQTGVSAEFKRQIINMDSVYGDGNTSEAIVYEIKRAFLTGIDLKKKFYDI